MKTKIISALCVVAFSLLSVTSTPAQQNDEVAVAADALVVRPLCFVATVIGSAVFVISLPAAAPSGSIDSAAAVLVKKPAWATFKRPLGDFGFAVEQASAAPSKRQHKTVALTLQSPKSRSARL